MKVLVLGSNGQLGSDLLRQNKLRGKPLHFQAVDRDRLDVSSPEKINPTLEEYDFDVLINCTSYHKTDEVELNATQAFAINAHAIRELAKSCRKKNARFVHISTDYVFSGDKGRPYLETDTPDPINVYGASKAMGEKLAQLEYADGIYILRVASLFGIAGASGKGGNFVETMIKIGKEKGKLQVVNDISMSPTATADAASVILDLIQTDTNAGIYHVVNSGQATWYEFAREIIERENIDAEIAPITSDKFPTTAVRPPFSVLDNSKIASIVGPIPSWKEALDCYLIAKGHIVTKTMSVG